MKFVDHIATYIEEHQLPLEKLTIVLPSERAKKYIAASLYDVYQKPIFAPKMITMDQWIKSYSDANVIDQTRALIKLFEVQLKEAKTEVDKSFDEFMTWGMTLLSDFNEIDRYLLDAKQVFRNLADIKEIENWSFGDQDLTKSQKRFMEFWDRLPGYYYALNEALDKSNHCYAGKAFRELTNHLEKLFEEDKKSVFLFAGFNALSAAELSIIKQLDKMGRAHVLIDADAYYFDDKVHEAGRFLRDLKAELDGRSLTQIQNTLRTKEMNVRIISCAQKTGQAKVAATILSDLPQNEIDQTLLLLADESLINAVIKNLPSNIGKANITLGLPIRSTAVKTWVELIFSIQENARRFKTKALYFYDLQAFWSHPFVLESLSESEKHQLVLTERNLIKNNVIFVKQENLNIGDAAQKLLSLLTTNWDSWLTALKSIRSMNQEIYRALSQTAEFEKAIIESFDKSLIDFENILTEGIPEMGIKSFKQLFHQHWSKQSIAYHGNPLDGLQIMGLLETRALDFKRIIAVGMNEGNLPPTNPIQTMIPMDLRKYLGLPTPREKQGLFAHHFYRLLHHCEDLVVTYSSADDAFRSNEPSRYLMQLELELSRLNKNVHLSKEIYSIKTEQAIAKKEIPKTPEILQRLDELFAQSTSASMLKKFTSCPLDFYFRYIMDFGEAEDIEEDIEHSTFGTFIHDTLEELYMPFARFDKEGNAKSPAPRNITSLDIDSMMKQFPVILEQKFREHFNNDERSFKQGKNLLSFKMAKELTKRFLKSEKAFLEEQTEPVFIESLEREYVSTIEVDVFGEKKKVRLRGFIDRIDSIGDRVRIIDYKTGKVQAADVKFLTRSKENLLTKSMQSKKHVLQLLMYAYMYRDQHNVVSEPSIISFVSGKNQPFALEINKGKSLDEVLDDFPAAIGEFLEEIYDQDTPFAHNDQLFNYCNYCD